MEICKGMAKTHDNHTSFRDWLKGGEPFVWLNAAAVTISIIAVVGLLLLLATQGLGHFWPARVVEAEYRLPGQPAQKLLAERVEKESVSIAQLRDAGLDLGADISDRREGFLQRELLKRGNRDIYGADFTWALSRFMEDIRYPDDVLALERREWGNFYGRLRAVKEQGKVLADTNDSQEQLEQVFLERIDRARQLREQLDELEGSELARINFQLEKLRLDERRLDLDEQSSGRQALVAREEMAERRAILQAENSSLQQNLAAAYAQWHRDTFVIETVEGERREMPIATVVRAYWPNRMSPLQKLHFYGTGLWAFLSEDPREANTEGGVFPAIFGTVIMVMIMSILVTPFGVMAAVYLREYAHQSLMIRTVRVAVNNLAGVPSIVYGVFGLGFFIYFLGSEIDSVFFPEALPAPTFGAPGLLWASVTLALLTLPVVIVATEEGLSRIPRNLREGSLALGATKAETLWQVVLPMASPAMMTGLILAVARAAGEVAPLMLVGVVKLAPSLPVDGNFPYLHLDQKFMHLGFHIYDVGFQSPNVEAARPLVYATALLLVIIIALLNFTAVALRNHLREKYKSLES
jgi:phosphate transport system permease protein